MAGQVIEILILSCQIEIVNLVIIKVYCLIIFNFHRVLNFASAIKRKVNIFFFP